ncbi:hypothetical protein BGZ75_005765 [Mortierella antarctica]|nr:hypothetical protein BGZ67_008593 [Mortierella alpina]KAF9982770.1 hypothetical protein BGZ75_005765 [Mortierella antarctica]
MSNYSNPYSNNNNANSGHFNPQGSSSAYRQEDYHPLQGGRQDQQQQQQQGDYGEKQQAKKRNLNPAKAVVGGITHGTQAVVGGVTQGTQAVRGGFAQVEKGVTNAGSKLAKAPGVSQGVSFFADYRKFMDRGNVIDLAVAVVIGAAFTAIVTSLVTDIITPVIALASGKNLQENFIILRRNATFPADTQWATRLQAQQGGNITWNWGNFVQTVINFFIVSACVFVIVKVYQSARNTKKEVTEKKCDYCLKDIPLNSVRCPNCTTWLDWDACAKVKNMERAAQGADTAVSSPFVDHAGGDYQNTQSSLARF